MYTVNEMLESIKKVEATRPSRVGVLPERLTAEQITNRKVLRFCRLVPTKVRRFPPNWQLFCRLTAV